LEAAIMTGASGKAGRVSVIGLGNMGSALAQALLDAGPVVCATDIVDNLILVRDAFAAERVGHLTVEAFLALLRGAKQAGDGGKDLAAVFARAIARAGTRATG
jgi:glutamate dehydrogenase/leucine dehydrogenase